jgi:hypothetical protein
MGQTGINVMMRLMGLIVMVIAVEFFLVAKNYTRSNKITNLKKNNMKPRQIQDLQYFG